MIKVGLHAGYWWGSGLENDYDAVIRLVADSGVDTLEINQSWIVDKTPAQRRELGQKIADAGLTVTVNGGITTETDISADDSAVRRAGIAYCKKVLQAVKDLGADIWSGANYSPWQRKGVGSDLIAERKRAMDYSLASLKELLPMAEDLGVHYCFEVVNRYEQFLFNTAEDALLFAQAADSPNATLLLDIYHMNIEENDMFAALTSALQAGKLGHLHLSESNRRIPGTGPSNMDWQGIYAALKAGGYEGITVMEPFVLPTAHNATKTCTWRYVSGAKDVSSMQQDAKTGAAFLKKLAQ